MQPSGWLMRLLSPYFTGFERPPIGYLFPDQHGFALVIALMAKETPFLILMTLSALSQINTRPLLTMARSLGYGPLAAWIYVIVPELWVRLKLPILIVLVFSFSVVDMAIIWRHQHRHLLLYGSYLFTKILTCPSGLWHLLRRSCK